VILVGLSSSALAQSKVGSALVSFLGPSYSARANGMGQAGVALGRHESAYHNPAALGLWSTQTRLDLSFNPAATEWATDYSEYRFHSMALYVPVSWCRSRMGLGLKFYRTRFESHILGSGYGGLNVFRIKDITECLDIAVGYRTWFEVALGAGLKRVVSEPAGIPADSWGAGLGLLLRLPLENRLNLQLPCGRFYATPSVGASWTYLEMGSDITLPETRRLGGALVLGSRNADLFAGWTIWQVTGVLEWEKALQPWAATQARYGAELQLLEAVGLRVGRAEGSDDTNTLGFSLASRGLARAVAWTLGVREAEGTSLLGPRTWLDRLSLEYSWARYGNHPVIDGTAFHEVAVTVSF
jgi:hypothetical protein